MVIHAELFRRLCRARDRLRDDPSEAPDLRQLARNAGLSPHHLLRVFRGCFGETPHEYLTRVRMARAKAALSAGQSVTDVCFDLGFSSLGSFSALFRRRVGVAPSVYRRSIRLVAPAPGLVAPLTVPFCFLQVYASSCAEIAILEKPLPFQP